MLIINFHIDLEGQENTKLKLHLLIIIFLIELSLFLTTLNYLSFNFFYVLFPDFLQTSAARLLRVYEFL